MARCFGRTLLPLACAIFVNAAIAAAQSGGVFVRTGSMTSPRSDHTATLLPDGRVLIAGGASHLPQQFGAGRILAGVEIYDPGAGTFHQTGSMAAARRGHTATFLPNDRVLIVGGYGEEGALASAELFGPATATFSPTGSLTTARGGHTTVLLPNGAVLIVGGYGTGAYPDVAPFAPLVAIGGRIASLVSVTSGHTLTAVRQVRVRVPRGIASGSAVPVRLLYMDRPTNAVTVAVR